MKKAKKLVSLILTFALLVGMVAPGLTTNAAKSKTKNTTFVKSIYATYVGDTKIIGNHVTKSDFKVIGKKSNGEEVGISNFKISGTKLKKTSNKVTISYKNEKKKTLKTTVTVKAIADFKSIQVKLNKGVEFDYGDKISKSMFTVTAITSSGKKKVLDNSAYEISSDEYDSDSTSMKLKFTATNNEGKEKKATFTIKATKAVKSISAKYIGKELDIGEAFSEADFEVTGKTYGNKTVKVTTFSISSYSLEKEKENIQIDYTNSFGKDLKARVSLRAEKLVKKITVSYVGPEKNVGDALSKEEFLVEGITSSGQKVEIKEFELSTTEVEKKNQSVKITYVNTLGNELKQSVTITGNNFVEAINATWKNASKKWFVGEEVKPGDIKVVAIYHDKNEKTLSSSAIKLDHTKIVSTNDTFTISYYDKDSKKTLTTTLTLNSTDGTTDENALVTYNGGEKLIGDDVSEKDFTLKLKTTLGNYVDAEITGISGNRLKDVTNVVTLKYETTDGTNGSTTYTVNATDYVKGISVERTSRIISDITAITADKLDSLFYIKRTWASGKEDTVTPMGCEFVGVRSQDGNANLKADGKLSMSGKNTTIVFTYTENALKERGNYVYTKEYRVENNTSALEQTIKFNNSSNLVKKKEASRAVKNYSLSKIVSGNKTDLNVTIVSGSNAVKISDGKIIVLKYGYDVKLRIEAKSGVGSDGKTYHSSNTLILSFKTVK